MSDAPAFFLPWGEPDQTEVSYTALAEQYGCAVPPVEKRVYSITYEHDGEEWTATVGKELEGLRPRKKARTRKEREMIRPMVRVSDGATVLAIFPGVAVLGGPFTVVTDFMLKPEVYSEWENPFTAHPTSVTYFSE